MYLFCRRFLWGSVSEPWKFVPVIVLVVERYLKGQNNRRRDGFEARSGDEWYRLHS